MITTVHSFLAFITGTENKTKKDNVTLRDKCVYACKQTEPMTYEFIHFVNYLKLKVMSDSSDLPHRSPPGYRMIRNMGPQGRIPSGKVDACQHQAKATTEARNWS